MTTTTLIITIDHDRPLPDNARAIIECRTQDYLVNGPGIRASVKTTVLPSLWPDGFSAVDVYANRRAAGDSPRRAWNAVREELEGVKTATSAPPSADTLKE